MARIGHGRKNANRGEAINRNAARVEALTKKVAKFQKELKTEFEELGEVVEEQMTETDMKCRGYCAKVQSAIVTHEIRMRYLERPWWKKLFGIKPELPITIQQAAEVIEKEEEVTKEEEEGHHVLDIQSGKLGQKSEIKKKDKAVPPATPSHRQVIVDKKTPGPVKREGEADGSKAESRDA